MNISQTSGSYVVTNRLFNWPSRSLCVYFWQFVLSVVVHIAVPVAAVLPFIAFGIGLSEPSGIIILLTIIGALVEGLGLMFGAVYAVVWSLDKAFGSVTLPTYDFSDNLVVQYVLAKKDKVCPILDFTDD